ncbi:MAG: inositol-3-phosphate synthase, partial [Planctomycetota bacterium]
MQQIKIAIVGIGNCASALIQGLDYYRQSNNRNANGLMNWDLGGYLPSDIIVAAAYDIDRRKVGQDVNQAIFQPLNCTILFKQCLHSSGVL